MNDFDDIIGGAVAGRADGAPTAAPDFSEVLTARQDRLRRRTTLAAGGLVVAGLAGIGLFATAGDEAPGVAGEPSSTPARYDEPTTTYDPVGGAVWYCVGRIEFGVPPPTPAAATTTTLDQLDPDETVPTSTLVDQLDPDETVPPTTDWPVGDSGYFAECSQVATLTEFPGDAAFPMPATTIVEVVEATAPPTTALDLGLLSTEDAARFAAETEARRAASLAEARRLAEEGIMSHIVETGDDVTLIAEQYCVAVADLLEFNGWMADHEPGLPGDLVLIPSRTTPVDCPSPAVPATTSGG